MWFYRFRWLEVESNVNRVVNADPDLDLGGKKITNIKRKKCTF
jgi:hypothetical protein